MKKIYYIFTIIAATLFAGIFSYLAFSKLNIPDIIDVLVSLQYKTLAIALIIFIAAHVLRIVRWWRLMKVMNNKLTFKACIAPQLLSVSISDFLPFRIGELFRTFAYQKDINVTPMKRVGTILIERLLDALVLLLFLFIGLIWIESNILPRLVIDSAINFAIISIFVLFTIIFFTVQIEKLTFYILNLKIFNKFKYITHVSRWLKQLFSSLTSIRSPIFILKMFLFSIAIWLIEGWMCVIIARDIAPSIKIISPIFALALGALSTALPAAPGMIGTLDYFLMMGIMAYGISRITAASFAIILHAYYLLFSIAILLYYSFNYETRKVLINIIYHWKDR